MCPCTGLITRDCVCVCVCVRAFFFYLISTRDCLGGVGFFGPGGGVGLIVLLISSLATYVVEDGAIPVENDC
jgi:hypothetical protein